MRVVNQVTFDAHNIPVIYNSAPFSIFFKALLVHPEDPLRAEFVFQERKQDYTLYKTQQCYTKSGQWPSSLLQRLLRASRETAVTPTTSLRLRGAWLT